MTRQYQRTPREASEETPARPAVPARVTVPLGEITANVQEGLLALVVGTGLQVMQAMFDADVAAVAGPWGKHDPARVAGRHGCGPGSVTLGGRRVPVTRPRVHAADRSGELPVPSYEVFTSTEMLGGLSTRRYGLGLEPVGEQVTETAKGTSKSAISRRFVQRTETTLAELLARPLGELDLIALMVDGVHFGEHLCVVALGIDADGTKHPLALVERSTENTATVRGLLGGLPDRGLDVARPLLVVIDSAKALTKAVKEIFDAPMIQRCQLHKIRNVRDHLPERLRGPVESRMRRAYHAHAALDAEAQLLALAKELDRTHPGAAGSLREGLTETLTILRLDVPPWPAPCAPPTPSRA